MADRFELLGVDWWDGVPERSPGHVVGDEGRWHGLHWAEISRKTVSTRVRWSAIVACVHDGSTTFLQWLEHKGYQHRASWHRDWVRGSGGLFLDPGYVAGLWYQIDPSRVTIRGEDWRWVSYEEAQRIVRAGGRVGYRPARPGYWYAEGEEFPPLGVPGNALWYRIDPIQEGTMAERHGF